MSYIPSGTNEDWMNTKWRPMMGWTYMITCIFDFIVAPILWSIAQAISNGGIVATQWNPLTLEGAGLYHVAMGAVLGITAWSRGQEKIAGAIQAPTSAPTMAAGPATNGVPCTSASAAGPANADRAEYL